jgi:hypothetical protein
MACRVARRNARFFPGSTSRSRAIRHGTVARRNENAAKWRRPPWQAQPEQLEPMRPAQPTVSVEVAGGTSMQGWLNGFVVGLAVGMSAYAALLVRERRRTRQVLAGLVEQGPFRLHMWSGQPASGAALVEALDAVLNVAPARPMTREQLRVMLLLTCLGALVGVALVVLVWIE